MKRVLLNEGLSRRTANRGKWTCVTLDHDFRAHLAVSCAGRPWVVFLRAQGLDSKAQVDLVRKVWEICEASLEQGAALSADAKSVRIRPLPLH